MKITPNPAWHSAPRISALKSAFEGLASGTNGQPSIAKVAIDATLILPGSEQDLFRLVFESFAGPFDAHYLASIPYIFEENCRQGAAFTTWLGNLSQRESRPASLLTIETSEATFARSVVKLSQGAAVALSTSSTARNFETFERSHPPGSHFWIGPFFDITPSLLHEQAALAQFSSKFDVVLEDTAFQMYGADRAEQIKFVSSNLREGGLFVCIEKCLNPNPEEYLRREQQKDQAFKAKYFSGEQLLQKAAILEVMKHGQVSLETLKESLRARFKHCHLTWSSGNFLVVVASDDAHALDTIVSLLGPMRIPNDFAYHKMSRLF